MRLHLPLFRRGAAASLAIGAMVLGLSGRAAPQAPPPAQAPAQQGAPQPGEGAPQPIAPALGPVAQDYTVSPGDVLEVSVLGEPAVSGPVTVGPDGSVMMQLIGKVPAAGLTLSQLTERIRTELRKYIRDPQVVVSIRQTALHRQFVYLVGQVGRPGAYEIQSGWTVASLIAAAGGPTPAAGLPKAFILRQDTRIPVDLQQLLINGNTSANVPLQAGDVVIVPEAQDKVLVMGQVARPGAYLYKPGDRLVDLLSAAGGPTPQAAISNIGVVRQAGSGKPTVTPVNLDKFYKSGDGSQNAPLQAGDVVYVPEKSGVNWQTILGTIVPFLWLLK